MLKYSFALMVLSLSFAASGADVPAPLDPKVNNGVLPARYGKNPLIWIPKSADPQKLSGNMSDPAWKAAAHFTMLDTTTAAAPPMSTEAWLFCTDTALYIGVRCQEAKMGELQVSKDEIWARDSMEIFVEPYRDTIQRPYHHLIVDGAGNTETHRYHVYQKIKNFPRLGEADWKANAEVASARTDKDWSLEIKLPFKDMKLSDDAKQKKTLWRMNLYRTRPAKSDSPKTLSWALSPPGVQRYHEPGRFAYVLPEVFATKELIDDIVKNAGPPAPPEKPIDPAEIDKCIADLGAENFDTRQNAVDRLKVLSDAGPKLAEAVEAKLKTVLEQSKVPETWSAAKDAMDALKVVQDRRADEDPPPFGFE